MQISIKDKDGNWKTVENKNERYCDRCGGRLWIAPDGKTIYCYCLPIQKMKGGE